MELQRGSGTDRIRCIPWRRVQPLRYTNGESLPLQFPPANEGEGRTAVVRNHVTGKGKALAHESKGDFGPSYDAKGRHDMCLLY